MIQISKNNSDLEKLFKSQKIIQISKNIQFSKNYSDLKKLFRSQKIIRISKNYSDLKKLFGSQKIIQISKYLKCKIKHTLVLKGHQPDLWRYPGLVRIRKEGT